MMGVSTDAKLMKQQDDRAGAEITAAHTKRNQAALFNILSPIASHDKNRLREVVKRLKHTDGESWAVGEMLERALEFLK